MAVVSRAEATWSGSLVAGSGEVSAASSRRLHVAADHVGRAHRGPTAGSRAPRSCSRPRTPRASRWRFASNLTKAGTPPTRLEVAAEVTFDKLEAGWKVASSALTVRGTVPGISAADFAADRRGGQGRLPDQRGPQGQRGPQRRGDPRGLTAQPIVRSRRGFATVIVSISASETPASRSRGRNVSAR